MISVCKLHSTYAESCSLGGGDLLFQETEEITAVTLEHHLLHLTCTADKNKFVILSKFRGCDRSLGHIKLSTINQFTHGCLCHKKDLILFDLSKRRYIQHLLLAAVIVA